MGPFLLRRIPGDRPQRRRDAGEVRTGKQAIELLQFVAEVHEDGEVRVIDGRQAITICLDRPVYAFLSRVCHGSLQ